MRVSRIPILMSLGVILVQEGSGQWVKTAGPPAGADIMGLHARPTVLLAGTFNGTFRKSTAAVTWQKVSGGLANQKATSFASDDSLVCAGTAFAGVFLSFDDGRTWNAACGGLNGIVIEALDLHMSKILAGTNGGGIFASTDYGGTWQQSDSGLTNLSICAFARLGVKLFAATNGGGVQVSTDNGYTWGAVNNGLGNLYCYSLLIDGSDLFVGTGGDGVYRSTDSGLTWLPSTMAQPNTRVGSLLAKEGTLFAGTYENGLFSSIDTGKSWTSLPTGYSDILELVSFGEDIVLAAGGDGLSRSSDLGLSWQRINSGLSWANVYALTVIDSVLWSGGENSLLSVTSDKGLTWVSQSEGVSAYTVYCIERRGPQLLAGTSAGVFRSADGGQHWHHLGAGLTSDEVRGLAVSGLTAFAAANGTAGGVFRLAADDTTWQMVDGMEFAMSVCAHGPYLFAGSYLGRLDRSSDNGENWHQVSNAAVFSIGSNGSAIFAGTMNQGVLRSTDDGVHWQSINDGLTDLTVLAILADGPRVYAGTYDGVFMSDSNGARWRHISEGLAAGLSRNDVRALAVAQGDLMAGLYEGASAGGGVWRRPLSEVTAVEEQPEENPRTTTLFQNYPNPFNPRTQIRFQIARSSLVRLTVFDILGREIADIVNKELKAGQYEKEFDGSNCATGLYICRLQAGDVVQYRKLVLVR